MNQQQPVEEVHKIHTSILNNKTSNNKVRNSSIELLKIIGIALIVLSHVVYSLYNTDTANPYTNYIINLKLSTTNAKYLILSMLKYGGIVGNAIFFISSAWFLLDSKKNNKRKALQMIADTWIISAVFLIITYILRQGNIDTKLMLKSLLPITFGNTWYITCYILFYFMYPYLNKIINNVDKQTLLRIVIVMSFLYIIMNFIKSGLFYSSNLVLWITLYFLIAYMKLYLKDISNNKKINIGMIIFGFFGNFFIIIVTNILGLHIESFNDKLLHWDVNCNPFIIMFVIGIFNIVRNIHFENKVINYASSLSLLIYIIHDNILFRIYYRTKMWNNIYKNYGYEHIFMWVFILTIIIFSFSLITSVIYKSIIQKLVTKVCDNVYPKICEKYKKIENEILKLK